MTVKWEELDRSQQLAMARAVTAGSKQSNDNINRALEQLADNPALVQKYAKEVGVDDQDESETQNEATVEQSAGADEMVDRALKESGDPMEAGELPKTDNADLEQRVRMLESALRGRAPTRNADTVAQMDGRDGGGEYTTDTRADFIPSIMRSRTPSDSRYTRGVRGPDK